MTEMVIGGVILVLAIIGAVFGPRRKPLTKEEFVARCDADGIRSGEAETLWAQSQEKVG